MSEAAFFYNTTCTRPDKTKPPSAHINISIYSQAQPIHPFSKTSLANPQAKPNNRNRNSSGSSKGTPSSDLITPQLPASKDANKNRGDPRAVGMLPTPLVNYKHAANQSTKVRAAADARRKSSSTSGNSGSSKNASSGGDPRSAMAARTDTAGRSSSVSESTGSSGLTAVTSTDPPSTDAIYTRPFSRRNGRRYLRDTSLPYPLPCDLHEIHRQTLRTMLLCQVFNGPICSPAFKTKPPKRVLEIACGTGFWSVMCHRHFSQRGFSSISFTGVDIAPLAPRMDTEDDMNWRFVQHDLRKIPLPFRDDEFNLIMCKDMSLVMSMNIGGMQQALVDEYLRILKPGGTMEVWDGDHSIRMLLPHTTPPTNDDENDDQVHTNAMGIYTITPQTPFAAPQNPFLLEYNTWVTKALEARNLSPMPCTSMRPLLLQESELIEIDSRRLAIPLGEVRWEREGVGGAITSLNGLHSLTKGKSKESSNNRKVLTAGQSALRKTALMTVTQMIENLEPILLEASGKRQDEWDRWQGHMMTDLLKNNGTSWGECLEVGAWWARKKKP